MFLLESIKIHDEAQNISNQGSGLYIYIYIYPNSENMYTYILYTYLYMKGLKQNSGKGA